LAVVAGSRQVQSVFALIGADRELELVDRPSRLLACASRPARADCPASQLLANADELTHMLRRAAGAGIDPRRVLLALGLRPHRTESDAC
jgi:hypothetical protein